MVEEMEVETRCRRRRRWRRRRGADGDGGGGGDGGDGDEDGLDPFAWWAFKPGSRREEWASWRRGGKNRANFESKLYQCHGTRARKTGAEKVREKRVGVWSFWGAFLFEKRYRSKQLFHVEAVATAKDFANNFHD